MSKKNRQVTVANATPREVLSDSRVTPGTFAPLPPDGRFERNRRLSEAWQRIAASLKERPQEWCMVGRKRTSYVTQINNGRLAAFRPAGDFEASSRNVDEDGYADLWVRFIGEA